MAQIIVNPRRADVINPPAGASYTTDSLYGYWVFTSLSDGNVTTWYDETDSKDANKSGTGSLTKSAAGITTDGASSMQVDSLPVFSGAITVEIVAKIVDTTAAQVIAGVRKTNYAGITVSTFGYITNRCTGGGEISVRALPIYNTVSHIVATTNGVDAGAVYFNGVLQTDVGNDGSVASDGYITMLGNLGGGYASNGTILLLCRIYKGLALTQEQVTANYNSDSVQDLLP